MGHETTKTSHYESVSVAKTARSRIPRLPPKLRFILEKLFTLTKNTKMINIMILYNSMGHETTKTSHHESV